MFQQLVTAAVELRQVNIPPGLDFAGKSRHRIGVYTYGVDALFFALDEGRPCSHEGIENYLVASDAKSVEQIRNQVVGIGQHEAMPIVYAGIFEFLNSAVCTRLSLMRHVYSSRYRA